VKKMLTLALLCGVVLSFAALFNTAAANNNGTPSDDKIIADLLKSVQNVNLSELQAIPAKPFTLPPAGVDVMRVRMEETYTIDGVGTDTVELSGWIAAKHDNARPLPGQTEVTWGTAVIDTEFVGLELHGTSKIFGPVSVRLTPGAPSFGQVGAFEVPELKEKMAAIKASAKPGQTASSSAACVANISVDVDMPQLDLRMKTQQAVRMYSIVETIPPVGHTASVSLTPTPLIADNRAVGTLNRAEVKFREIVMKDAIKGTSLATR
jgi:hypothetical protein